MAKRKRYDDDDYEPNPESGRILGMKPMTALLVAGGVVALGVLIWKRRKQLNADRQSRAALNQSGAVVNVRNAARQAATSMATPAQTGAPPNQSMAGLRDRRAGAGPAEVFDDGMGGRLGEFGADRN